MFQNYKTENNVVSTLEWAVSSLSTTIVVHDSELFPSSFPYLLTVEQKQGDDVVVREIMKATAKNWTSITVERAVEPCISDETESPKVLTQVAHNFKTWSSVWISMTAWILKDVNDEIISQSERISESENEIVELNDYITQLENDIADL